MTETTPANSRAGMMRVARSRGALSGLVLLVLGLWGALVPFIGPLFDFAYTPASAWTWTAGRFWLEVLPGIAAIVGGLLLMGTANRAVGVFAGYLASAAGAWFIVGPILGQLWNGAAGAAGMPAGTSLTVRVLEQLFFFYGLGAAILFFAATALGRFTVRSVRDVRAGEKAAAEKQARSRATEPAPSTPVATTPVTPAPTTPVAPVTTTTTAPASPAGTSFAGNRTEVVGEDRIGTSPNGGATRAASESDRDR